MIRRSLLLLATLATIACDDDAPTDAGADARVDGAADGGGLLATLPTSAEVPILTPCPTGYRETDADGVTVCDPWPSSGRAECDVGQAHFPGSDGCAVVGSACPADGLPADVPSDALYVSSGATAGTGARDQPFGTVAEAIAVAAAGDTIALGAGVYAERVTLPGGVTLVGACTAETRLYGLDVGGTDTVVRNLTLGGGPGTGIAIGAGESADVSDVVIDRAIGGAVIVRGGSLTAARLAISDIGGASVADGCGVGVYAGGSAEVDGLVIARARADGVYVTDEGSTAVIRNASIFDVQPNGRGEGGRGAVAFHSGAPELAGAVIEDCRSVAVLARDRATATLTDVVVRRTLPREADLVFGRAASALDAATLTATRLFAENNRDVGVFSEGDGTNVTLTDVVIRDMGSEAVDGSTGKAIQAQNGGTMTVERALFARARDAAMIAHGELTLLTATDVTIRDTLDQEVDPRGGWGAGTQFGGSLVLTRAVIEGSREIGLYASGRTTSLTATDVVVRDTESHTVDGTQGRGINVQLVATATLSRVLVERSREAGVLAIGTLTRIEAEDLTIRETREEACAADGCVTNGSSLGSYDEAEISVRRFHFDDADVCGVWLDEGGALDLSSGEVSNSTIGACILDESFDSSRVSEDVRYRDNETNLDAPSLPVPATIDEIPI